MILPQMCGQHIEGGVERPVTRAGDILDRWVHVTVTPVT